MDDLLKIIKFTHEFQKVKRVIKYPDTLEYENDMEHSYQMALVGWYIISSRKMPLDINLVIKYCLVHDLVEIYAGDVSFFRSEKAEMEKKEREKKAQEKIEKEFSEFRDLHHLINQYEKRATKEAQFTHALDKLLASFTCYTDNGNYWKENGITFDMWLEKNKPAMKQSPEIEKYFNELSEFLSKNKKLFAPDK